MALWILTANRAAGLAPLVYREEPLNPQLKRDYRRPNSQKLSQTLCDQVSPLILALLPVSNGAERCLSSHFFHWHPLPAPYHCPPLHSTLEPGVVERKQLGHQMILDLNPGTASRHISTLDELALCLMVSASASSSVKWAVMRSHSCHHSVIQQTLREHLASSLERACDLWNALGLTRDSFKQRK